MLRIARGHVTLTMKEEDITLDLIELFCWIMVSLMKRLVKKLCLQSHESVCACFP